MRTALSISTLFLIVIIAYGFQIGAFAFGADSVSLIAADVDVGRSVRIYSCAEKLPPVRFGDRPQYSSIYVDGKLLHSFFNETGLRLVTIPPGDAPPALHTFFLPRDVESPERLREVINSIPVDTAIALASFRTIQPKGKEKVRMRNVVLEVLKDVGAQTDPTADNLVSWGLLSIRRPEGWLPLSEVYSKTKGMSISYNLEDDRSRYDGIESVLRVDQSKRLGLEDVIEQATKSTEGLVVTTARVGGVSRKTLAMPLIEDAAVKWRFVKLGHFPTFSCVLGVPSDAYEFVPGALCSLLINGEVIATQGVGKNAGKVDEWVAWNVDLSKFADRWVTVELKATPLANTLPISVFWGRPRILSSPTKEISFKAFDRLLHRFDMDKDSVVGPPEVSQFLRAQDLDRDGFVTTVEAFKPDVVKGVDYDGDGKASYAELDTWFDQLLDPPD